MLKHQINFVLGFLLALHFSAQAQENRPHTTLSPKATLEASLPLAKQGDAPAQNTIGLIYFNGRGVPQNFKEAFTWFDLAARQGYRLGQINVGKMYESGMGINKDLTLALMWFIIAASTDPHDDEEGKFSLQMRDALNKTVGKDAVDEAQTLAKLCIESLFKKCGDPFDRLRLLKHKKD